MATIIEFPNAVLDELDGAARGSQNLSDASATAEIIIFPGVRIERWEEEPHGGHLKTATAGVRRDQMELLDS